MKIVYCVMIAWSIISCSQTPVVNDQNYEIYPGGDGYVVRGAIDLKTLHTSNQATEAIQWAVNKLGEGGEVFLHKGKYLLTAEIELNSNVTLRGSGTGSQLIIQGDHATGNALIIKDKNNASVVDLAIKSIKDNNKSNTAITVDNSGNCTIDGVTIVGMKQDGILFTNNTFISTITNCRIAACEGNAIKLHKLARGGRGGDFVTNNVESSSIYLGGYGVYCDNALDLNIRDITTYQTKMPGYFVGNHSNSTLVSSCRSFQTQNDAIVVDHSHEINISSCIFSWSEGNGLVLNEVRWGTITGNNFIDNGSINPFERDVDSLVVQGSRPFRRMPRTPEDRNSVKSGVVMSNNTKGVTVTGNAIFNWPAAPMMQYGIVEDATCMNNVISSNNVNHYKNSNVSSNGKGTQVQGNFGYGEKPYEGSIGIVELQYFDLRLMEIFVEDMWK